MNMTLSVLCFLLWAALLQGLAPSLCHAQTIQGSFELDARLTLRAYEALVEDHLAGALNGLKGLAATREAASGDWQQMRHPLMVYARGVPAAAVWFSRPDGSYFTVAKGRVGATLKDRPYFAALMHGDDVEGRLIVSKSTGARAVVVATPIVVNGRVIGALGASLSVVKLAKWVNDSIGFPDNVIFYALDSRGLTALHKHTSLIFQFPSDIGDASLKSAVHKMLSEPSGIVRYSFNGARRMVIFKQATATHWVFALGITHPGR